MNFFVGQFFTMNFMGVLVPKPDDRYEWLKGGQEMKPLFGGFEINNQRHVTPPGMRWMN